MKSVDTIMAERAQRKRTEMLTLARAIREEMATLEELTEAGGALEREDAWKVCFDLREMVNRLGAPV